MKKNYPTRRKILLSSAGLLLSGLPASFASAGAADYSNTRHQKKLHPHGHGGVAHSGQHLDSVIQSYRQPSKTHATAPSHNSAQISKAPTVLKKPPPPKPIIMLDPGHGGKDPGAVGYTGTYEKHVAQAAGLELYELLMKSGRYRPVLTRSRDFFIPLDGRVELAHDHRASLFISLHADAVEDHSIRGASVYTHAHHASDSLSANIERSENSADKYSNMPIQGASPEVRRILASLITQETQHGSNHMASEIVSSFQNSLRLLPNPHRQAAFVVLRSAQIPSVLIEMGFMSSRRDEQDLRRQMYRMRVAQTIHTAIDRYFASAGMGLAT